MSLDTQRRYVQRKKDWLAQYKLERGCTDCGYAENAAALDLDHLDPATKHPWLKDRKSGGPRTAYVLSWELMKLEAEKCEVACANCHRIRTVLRLEVPGGS